MALPCPVETLETLVRENPTPNLTPTPSSPKSEISSPTSDIDTSDSESGTPESVKTPLSPKCAEAESKAEPRTPLKQIRKFKPPAVPPSVVRPSPWTPAFRSIGKCAVHGYFPSGHGKLPRTCPCDS